MANRVWSDMSSAAAVAGITAVQVSRRGAGRTAKSLDKEGRGLPEWKQVGEVGGVG